MDDSETEDADVAEAYRARAEQLRGLAAGLSGDLRETLLDVAEHWESLATQASVVARSRKLIKDWELGKTGRLQ
jgi:hypothetical protein